MSPDGETVLALGDSTELSNTDLTPELGADLTVDK